MEPSQVLKNLVDLLSLERLEDNLFRGSSRDLGWGQVFGGQVLGQALSAANQTVPDERIVHSLHGYFLRTGDVTKPIVYDVDRIRDGRSFTTRRVVAIQKGRPIFNMSASFQITEPGFEHHSTMPEAPEPESLMSDRERVKLVIDQVPPERRKWLEDDGPIEVRQVDPNNPFTPEVRPAKRKIWYRVAGELPDDPMLHRLMLTYASDFNLLGSAMQVHGVSWLTPGMQVASLDHAMWFHRPVRFDDWVLHDMESPSASAGRALVTGRFYGRDGALVASLAQEGLIRKWAGTTKTSK